MKEKKLLTRVETQVMNILWSLPDGGVTSAEVMECHPEPKPAMTTLLTFLKRLTEKGFVRSDKEGKLLRFTPLISCDEYTSNILMIPRTLSSAAHRPRLCPFSCLASSSATTK